MKDLKQQLRITNRSLRKSFTNSYKEDVSNIVCSRLFPILKNYQVIGVYIPIDNELNILPLMNNLSNLGIKLVIPLINMEETNIIFIRWNNKSIFYKNLRNYNNINNNYIEIIPEILVVPMIAFDNNCNRLGFGGGWYDRYIAMRRSDDNNFQVIGVAYQEQCIKYVPMESHDMKVSYIITNKNCYGFL